MQTPLIIEPTLMHQYSVIWLHGLGASANDFYSLIPKLSNRNKNAIRWIFPNAPIQPVTLNNGMPMPSWFDILTLDTSSIEKGFNFQDIENSSSAILALAKNEIKQNCPYVCLVGFSQGACIALHAGLQADFPVHILMLSGTAPKICLPKFNDNCQSITMHHGTYDKAISIEAARYCYNHLLSLGYGTKQALLVFQEYLMGHEVCTKQIADLSNYFEQL